MAIIRFQDKRRSNPGSAYKDTPVEKAPVTKIPRARSIARLPQLKAISAGVSLKSLHSIQN